MPGNEALKGVNVADAVTSTNTRGAPYPQPVELLHDTAVPAGHSQIPVTLTTDERGQDLIEYALLAGLISLVAVTAVLNVGSGVNGVWGGVDNSMAAVPAP